MSSTSSNPTDRELLLDVGLRSRRLSPMLALCGQYNPGTSQTFDPLTYLNLALQRQ